MATKHMSTYILYQQKSRNIATGLFHTSAGKRRALCTGINTCHKRRWYNQNADHWVNTSAVCI